MLCALWSFIAKTSPATTNQNSISGYVQHLNKLDMRGFDFTNGLRLEGYPNVESRKIIIFIALNSILKLQMV